MPLLGKTTFYRLIDTLSTGRHTFGSAVTRRQLANRPEGPFAPTLADRPGEQIQIDSTPLDVMVLLDSGVAVRADLTIAVDVATRTICAAVLRPMGTKAVDASLLLAKMLVPEPMRPGWSTALKMSASLLPHGRLMDIDARMEAAAAKPVIVPDGVVIDGGRVFISETFIRACERLGISVQRARPNTPTDKAVVEATFPSINSQFTQFLAGYTGSRTDRRGHRVEDRAAWTVPELQDLLDEWLISWQHRPHDALRDPFFPRRRMSPNEKYASLVAACGYLPLVLAAEDYLELLPVRRRVINDYGIRIDYRTYDCAELWPLRRQHSGNARMKGLWEVHYDPYDLSQVFVRTKDGWLTVPWTHRAMVTGPFADFTWNLARRETLARGGNDKNETEVARVLDAILTRAHHGPARDREERHEKRIVAYQRLLGTGRLLIQLNRKQISARRGGIVSGASGTGKTTAITQLGRAHEIAIRKRYPRDVHRLPVIYVTVPPAATPRMLAIEFARFFGVEFSSRANLTDIINAVCHLAAHTHVDLVLVDEIHNISLATRTGAETSDQLKYFAERIRATFFLAGVEVEAQGLFAGPRGRQIAGRFTVVPATQFAYGTAKQREDWKALVSTMETMLRLHDHASGILPYMAESLYQRSGGAIGSLSQLIRGAAVLAIEDGTEQITEDLLDLVPVDFAAHTAYTAAKTRGKKKRTPAAEAV